MTTRLALCLSAALFAALTVGTPRLARADAQQQQSFSVWNQMADCARVAFKQYPDYTPEGNAKREAARVNCLRARRLPVNTATQQTGH